MGSKIVGTAGVLIASFFWGSNFIVCRGYDLPSDGMHFVLLMSTGILLVGILTLFTSAHEDGDFEVVFSPDGLIGGAIWAVGNFLTVPILRNSGLGVGFATWCGVNLVVAFAVGAIGLCRVLPGEALKHPSLGAAGVVLAIAALALFANVRPSLSVPSEGDHDDGARETGADESLLRHTGNTPSAGNSQHDHDSRGENSYGFAYLAIEETVLEQHTCEASSEQSVSGNRLLGMTLATVAGILYGFQFVPLSMWHNKVERAGHMFDQDLPSELILATRFFFSQFAGIFLTSLLGFSIYCVCRANRPLLVPPEAMLPSVFSGIVWAVGCAGGMLATAGLGNAVGFPLLLNGAFLVNSSWSILYFKEIQGARNLQLFGGAFLLIVTSSILISLAKDG
uniref:EamA domain-containing protein n=1 Tax=Odontella aurita TaxID=265563 RepID=A0A7S4HV00_9STRA|mmetsp:Transcript_15628/g.45096  ORF Transcript_15628/g.45096 Transcript_15628/m.45096 type:complete len:394 (+) Transcript_15628:130-1311(+)|eukprot:CAMPEP_0113556316 /NCGR_PEP_ID=MMETSP0015_2-20120614/17193_1 /TAXON_ID=2838 /ORGANISM="Odontella" /LENGTH=393 /DNA_ID=CAMNT_0000457667 /DNA_START=126 /DNA_END=1307 /DNA_ORIENTATION=- /assembly_acc=CAM_ASM_000160